MADVEKFKVLEERIRAFVKARNWEQFHDPKNMAAALQIEAAEVLELFLWTQENNINPDKESELSDELADVLYCIMRLADIYDINLLAALTQKMDKNEQKYPVEKAKDSAVKYDRL